MIDLSITELLHCWTYQNYYVKNEISIYIIIKDNKGSILILNSIK